MLLQYSLEIGKRKMSNIYSFKQFSLLNALNKNHK
jgi:hypothetical protein